MTPAQLRTWRTERGLTQAALGALLGLAVRNRNCETLARYERGESPIPRVLELALEALNYRQLDKMPHTAAERKS